MATYYLATTGTDGGGIAGDINNPFRTFSYAGTRLAAGDTLIVRGGTYDEFQAGDTFPSGTDWTTGAVNIVN